MEDGVRFVPITNINAVETNVYDEHRKLLIMRRFMKDKERWVSNAPMLSYRGIKIIELYVRDQIENSIRYRKHSPNYLHKLYSHFAKPKDQAEMDVIDALLLEIERNVYEHLWKKINEFVGNRDWNMYFISIKDQFLSIERYCDWRIYDWTQRMESGEWK